MYYRGYHGDCSKTFLIGDVDEQGRELVGATEDCVKEAISICRPGEYISTIGRVIAKKARRLGYSSIAAFAGHGIGEYFHGPPDIFHIGNILGTKNA